MIFIDKREWLWQVVLRVCIEVLFIILNDPAKLLFLSFPDVAALASVLKYFDSFRHIDSKFERSSCAQVTNSICILRYEVVAWSERPRPDASNKVFILTHCVWITFRRRYFFLIRRFLFLFILDSCNFRVCWLKIIKCLSRFGKSTRFRRPLSLTHPSTCTIITTILCVTCLSLLLTSTLGSMEVLIAQRISVLAFECEQVFCVRIQVEVSN